jgi:hypothetical protein
MRDVGLNYWKDYSIESLTSWIKKEFNTTAYLSKMSAVEIFNEINDHFDTVRVTDKARMKELFQKYSETIPEIKVFRQLNTVETYYFGVLIGTFENNHHLKDGKKLPTNNFIIINRTI